MMLIWHPSRRKAAQASPFNRSSHKILGQPMPRPQHLAVFLVCSAQVETPKAANGPGPGPRELPSDEVLASWQHVEQRALDLHAAGMPGSLRELRVRAYLDLLRERDSRDQPAGAGPAVPVPAVPG